MSSDEKIVDSASWRNTPKREYKPRDSAVTSRMMSKVRAKNSRAEVMLRKALWRRGLRYRIHYRELLGRPDVVFPRARVVVFIDGDFWHGRAVIDEGEEAFLRVMRTARRDWWLKKITKTIERDRTVTAELQRQGWTVIRMWESAVLGDIESSVKQIQAALGRT
jgi:DNA mismatch endonuclease (patch repair protein)